MNPLSDGNLMMASRQETVLLILVLVSSVASVPDRADDSRLLSPGSAASYTAPELREAQQQHDSVRVKLHSSSSEVASQIQSCLTQSRQSGRQAAKILDMIENLISPIAGDDLGESMSAAETEDPRMRSIEKRAQANAQETLELRSAAQDESAEAAMDEESENAQLEEYMQLSHQKTGAVIDSDQVLFKQVEKLCTHVGMLHRQISDTLKLETRMHKESKQWQNSAARGDLPIAIKMQRVAYRLSKHAFEKTSRIQYLMKDQIKHFQHMHDLSESIQSEYFNPSDRFIEVSEGGAKAGVHMQVYHDSLRIEEQLQRADAISKKTSAVLQKDNMLKEEMLNRVQNDASSSAWSTYNSARQARKAQMLSKLKVANHKLEGAQLLREKMQESLRGVRDSELKPALTMIKQVITFTKDMNGA